MVTRGQELPADVHVVRTVDRWLLADPRRDDPERIGVERLLVTLGLAEHEPLGAGILRRVLRRTAARRSREQEPEGVDDVAWEVTRTFACQPTPDGLLVGTTHGERVLDATDLIVIDASDGRTTLDGVVAAVERRLGSADTASVGSRIQSLVESGLLVPCDPDASAPVEDADVAESWMPPTVVHASDRVPVYALWHQSSGPLLSLGMLTAYLRSHEDGRLLEHLEIHPPQPAEWVLEMVEADPRPSVLLCSNYVWTIEENLEVARRVRALSPGTLIVHGGPSTPGYPAETAAFFAQHGDLVDVAVHGEGEMTLARLLERAVEEGATASSLHDVEGISFRGEDGSVVTTPKRERIADLDVLPSPFLTGEFDHIPREAWRWVLAFETNRGCPYGCSFCDWGSATMSRIRKFDLERVIAEIRWAADRGFDAFDIADANFGILPRDVDIAAAIAGIRRSTGVPVEVAFTPAKNGRKNLPKILDHLVGAAIVPNLSLGIQTTSESILDDVNRSNIATEGFVQLARELRARGISVNADLLIGLPGQTYETYRRDLQFLFDHEIASRSWPVQLLPNAPMNDPDYRERHRLVTDDRKLVVASESMTRASFDRMLRLRYVDTVSDRMGVLRHPLRLLQWDHGVPASDVMDAVVGLLDEDAPAYPAMAWLFTYFDLFAVPPVSWKRFYDEFVRFVTTEFGVPSTPELRTVVELQEFLMPAWGRSFPATIELAHDYPSYHRDHTDDGAAGTAGPLSSYGPASFTVRSDPLSLCSDDLRVFGSSRDLVMAGDFVSGRVYELDSDLSRSTAEFAKSADAPTG